MRGLKFSDVVKGTYTIRQTVNDGRAPAVTLQKTFVVGDLTIQGYVEHAPRMDELRRAYNMKVSGDPEKPRPANMFVAGEVFVLRAETTDTGSLSTRANRVRVVRSPSIYSVDLSSTDRMNWSGEMLDSNYNRKLADGVYNFTFTAWWPNGHTESVTVPIIIQDDYTLLLNAVRLEPKTAP